MKLYLRNRTSFSKETLEFYEQNFEICGLDRADIVVVNDFNLYNYPDKIVACNSTATEHINAKEIISLQGEDLSDLTAVAELCLGMAIYTTRVFKREEIKGKTLGIIGHGRIADQFINLAVELGMNWESYDKKWVNDNIDDVLKKSDIVSLHITAN